MASGQERLGLPRAHSVSHTGKVVDDLIEAKGEVYQAKQHGFARLMEHTLVRQTEDTIVMELRSSRKLYGFSLMRSGWSPPSRWTATPCTTS